MPSVLRLAILLLALAAITAPCSGSEAARPPGEGIYREGMLPSGQPLKGAAQAGLVRTGRDAACLGCHRRSGFGTAEGTFVVRPVTGADLFQTRKVVAADPRIEHQLGKPVRPAYDDATLARAIREGIDVTGRRMREVMPRYALDDADMAALIGYLKSLYVADAAGVSATEIHLATVIQPGVPAAKRKAMLGVLETFVREKNAGVRSEEARRTAGAMRMARAYRKWVLHTWDLAGPPQDWPAQLEAHYRRQPVFALVAGLGTASWQPIHAFSERFGIPCVLPLTDLPALQDDNFYTVYFSRGVALEADALAQFIDAQASTERIVQVYRAGSAGAAAAQAFRSALRAAGTRLEDRVLSAEAGEGFWQSIAATAPEALVLWLAPADLAHAQGLAHEAAGGRVYLSSTLLGGDTRVAAGLPALFTYPWELPSLREPRLQRSKLWLRSRGLEPEGDELKAIAVNTLFAITVSGDALAHLQDSFSQDYFVERVEHTITTTLAPTYYPRTSLGQGRRYASKGAYIVRPSPVTAVSDWIVP